MHVADDTSAPPAWPTSALPRETFPDTLAEQLDRLAGHPMTARFATSRRRLAKDRWRPAYHFTSPESTLNDPNGLCVWQGRWHLFYQGYPLEDRRRPHWGHAVSDDLIHWRDLPYAIHPGPENRCYSGTTLVERDRVIAMYHGTEVGNMVAVAADPLLLNWTKRTGHAVIPLKAADAIPGCQCIFDPCIWKHGDWYYSLSGHGARARNQRGRFRANFLFRSRDLTRWEPMHEFIEGDRFTLPGDDGACPYFLPIGDRHILLFYSHMSGGQYLLGDYDTQRQVLAVTAHGKFNFGASSPAGVHAPSATVDPAGDGSVTVIFNMNPGKPTDGWDQIMTLPRRLTLAGRDELAIAPAGAWTSLRGELIELPPMDLPANQAVPLPGVTGAALELEVEIDPQGASHVELDVLRSPDGSERTRVVCYPGRGMHEGDLITLDTSRSSVLPDVRCRAPETAPYPRAADGLIRLRVFVDHSVVEAFVNERQCVAARVYPGLDASAGASLRAQGADGKLLSLRAWPMHSAFP